MKRHAALVIVLASMAGCPGTTSKSQSDFERVALPEAVTPLYGEIAAYRSVKPRAGTARVELDLGYLVQGSKVSQVQIIPYDEEQWYEPVTVPLRGNMLETTVALDRDFLVALDLGERARNNYQAIIQLEAARGLLPDALRPRICTQILCPAEPFLADRLRERIPELDGLGTDVRGFLPPIEVGPIGRPGSICDQCFERPPQLVPCLLYKWCGKFPLPRKVYVRKNVYTLSGAEIASLRAGVAAMKQRPASDHTSWLYQARMHAVDSGTAAALQDQCQHRQFFFFAWHRMFTYYFERILRAASGDPDLALPYWNYTDVAAQRAIPEPFRIPGDTSNPLYNGTRSSIYNGGAQLPAADVSYASGFALTNFTTTTAGAQSFGGRTVSSPMHFPLPSPGSGQIELSPHNNVHNDIDGNMAQGESPRDPLFWLHHANIDRLWKRWLALGNGRANPTGHSNWMSQSFSFFDENGIEVSLTAAQILNTVSQLGYRYDDDPLVLWPMLEARLVMAAAPEMKRAEPIASMRRDVRLERKRIDVPIPVPEVSMKLLESSMASIEKDPSAERLVLRVSGIEYDEPVGVTFLLFLNLPEGTENPDHTNPSFIGTLGFFGGANGGHGGHGDDAEAGMSEEYDVTDVIRRTGATTLRLTTIPSLPKAPAGRKDIQKLIDELQPKGNPRFKQVELLRLESE